MGFDSQQHPLIWSSHSVASKIAVHIELPRLGRRSVFRLRCCCCSAAPRTASITQADQLARRGFGLPHGIQRAAPQQRRGPECACAGRGHRRGRHLSPLRSASTRKHKAASGRAEPSRAEISPRCLRLLSLRVLWECNFKSGRLLFNGTHQAETHGTWVCPKRAA